MSLMRPGLGAEVADSAGLEEIGHGRRVRVAGMVVARQRPATANGVVFMLLEDERGTINLIVPPPVVERCRMAIRSSGFVLASGRLEHREGTTNVLVSSLEPMSRSDEERNRLPAAEVRTIAPPVGRETGRPDETGRFGFAAERPRISGVWRGGNRPAGRAARSGRTGRSSASSIAPPASRSSPSSRRRCPSATASAGGGARARAW